MGECINLGIVRSYEHFRLSEMQMYEPLPKFGIQPYGIFASPFSNTLKKQMNQLSFKHKNFISIGDLNKIPLLSTALQYKFQVNTHLFNANKFLKDFDVLMPPEIFHRTSYQCIKSGVKTIIKVSENLPYNWIYNPPLGIDKTYHKKISRYVIKNASHFITISERAKFALMIQGVEEERITTILQSLDTKLFKPMPGNDYLQKICKLPSDSQILFNVGRLAEEKGIHFILYAFKRLVKYYPKLYLVIAGEGPLKKALQSLTRQLDLETKVFFVGNIPFSDMPKAYNSSSIAITASVPTRNITEQFGGTVFEPMSCAVPTISTFCGSIDEVLINNETGLLVPAADSMSLYNAVKTYLDNPDLAAKHAKAARKRCETAFEQGKIAKQYAETIKRIVS